MTAFDELRAKLAAATQTWLVTGVAGFIGSHLLEALLKLNQRVIGVDNFATGRLANLDEVKQLISRDQWSRFEFVEGDIRDPELCRKSMIWTGPDGSASIRVERVLHQAAIGSVPRSLADPSTTNAVNITGFLNVLVAARDANVKSFTYAASSSTYGDHPALPKVEDATGRPLSPYAVTKLVNELYADVFARVYGFRSIGLRYFNVFGPRQDPNGAYAAVIPKWTAALIKGTPLTVNGDGETSRDFCYVDNAVQANLLAAMTEDCAALNQIYNVAVGETTNLSQLLTLLQEALASRVTIRLPNIEHGPARAGDVRHSLADVSKAKTLLGYNPTHTVRRGLVESMPWYVATQIQTQPSPRVIGHTPTAN